MYAIIYLVDVAIYAIVYLADAAIYAITTLADASYVVLLLDAAHPADLLLFVDLFLLAQK